MLHVAVDALEDPMVECPRRSVRITSNSEKNPHQTRLQLPTTMFPSTTRSLIGAGKRLRVSGILKNRSHVLDAGLIESKPGAHPRSLTINPEPAQCAIHRQSGHTFSDQA